MKASQLIKQLSELVVKHGDVEVAYKDFGCDYASAVDITNVSYQNDPRYWAEPNFIYLE